MQNLPVVIPLGIALVMTMLSTWLWWDTSYYVIVALYAIGFFRAGMMDPGNHLPQSAGLFASAMIFGMMFYFVSLHKIMGRKVGVLMSNVAYKDFLLEKNRFSGFPKFVYYLPTLLLPAVVTGATYFKFMR